MEETAQYFGKRFFYKHVLEFHRPSEFYARHLGVKITGPYYAHKRDTPPRQIRME
jgi:hypothetical protein